MSGTLDARDFLNHWPFDPEDNVRSVGANGREFIVIRQRMGLEQYELDGRPDGCRKHGMESLFDFHLSCTRAAERSGLPPVRELTPEDCAELFWEAETYYHRLIYLFRLKDWSRAARDAGQLLRVLDFARQHARCAADRMKIEPWRPQITSLNTAARAMVLLGMGRCRDACETAGELLPPSTTADRGHTQDPGKLEGVLLESVRGLLVPFPLFNAHEESSFIRQDDFWTIRYQGHTAFLKCTRGLQCLAFLLHAPGREFHVSELLASLPDAPATASSASVNGLLHEDGIPLTTGSLYDGVSILDPRAKAECKSRLNDLRQEVEEAERFNDPARAARTRDEINAIAQHVASAIGLGGRDRKTSSDTERARCAVTKRIKQAIQKISGANPALGHHLTARIKTGYFCSYNPHPDRPVAWKL